MQGVKTFSIDSSSSSSSASASSSSSTSQPQIKLTPAQQAELMVSLFFAMRSTSNQHEEGLTVIVFLDAGSVEEGRFSRGDRRDHQALFRADCGSVTMMMTMMMMFCLLSCLLSLFLSSSFSLLSAFSFPLSLLSSMSPDTIILCNGFESFKLSRM